MRRGPERTFFTKARARAGGCLPVAVAVLPLFAIAGFASAQAPGVPEESGPVVDDQVAPLDPKAILKATIVLREIHDEAVLINSQKGTYSEIADRLLRVYRHGAETEDGAGDNDVNREFVRPFVIGLLRDLFFAGVVPSEFRNPLDQESLDKLCEVLGELIRTATVDLNFWNRQWVWDLAVAVCDAEISKTERRIRHVY